MSFARVPLRDNPHYRCYFVPDEFLAMKALRKVPILYLVDDQIVVTRDI